LKPTFIREKVIFRKDLGVLRLKVSQSTVDTGESSRPHQDQDMTAREYEDFVRNTVLPDYAHEEIRAIVIVGKIYQNEPPS
jgi:hypothetical protein